MEKAFLRCAKLLGIGLDKAPGESDPLPFDLARAHKLYKSLLGNLESLIKNKHLLIVASGPLSQLPFQVLVTKEPQAAHRWRCRLPQDRVAGQEERNHRATGGLLDQGPAPACQVEPGDQAADRFRQSPPRGPGRQLRRTRRAGRVPSNPAAAPASIAATADIAGAKALLQRNGIVDAADLRAQVPLPETADELCAVARDLKVAGTEVRLGASATEREIKSLSERGELSAIALCISPPTARWPANSGWVPSRPSSSRRRTKHIRR